MEFGGPYEAGVLQADNHLGREGIGLMAMGSSGRSLIGERRIERVGHGDGLIERAVSLLTG